MQIQTHLSHLLAKRQSLAELVIIVLLTLLASIVGLKAYAQNTPILGEVRKVDEATAKITLKHGEIKSLDMPPMTMSYRVKDKAMLNQLQPGDKVYFTAEKLDSQYVITSLNPASK